MVPKCSKFKPIYRRFQFVDGKTGTLLVTRDAAPPRECKASSLGTNGIVPEGLVIKIGIGVPVFGGIGHAHSDTVDEKNCMNIKCLYIGASPLTLVSFFFQVLALVGCKPPQSRNITAT